MMATWMLYCTLCALGLSVAAMLAERVLLAGRGAVRQVWFGAVVLSLLVPVIAYRYAPRGAVDASSVVSQELIGDELAADGASPATSRSVTSVNSSSPVRTSWRALLARADQPLAIIWLTLSVALALRFLFGLIGLVRTRRNWGSRVVLGVPVLVSERTGPALVGAVSPAIVVPEWALALEAEQLALMLRHEQEHQRAHDGQLLFAAQFALIVMPWNVALWWQLLRLRVAVELDCDARVLRDADARSYGSLLLDVVGRQRTLAPAGAALFAEHATQLERRIRVMARRRNQALRGAHLLAGFVALAAVTIAWIAPRPPVPVIPTVARILPPSDPPASQATRDTLPPATRDTVRAPSPSTARGIEATRPTRAAPPPVANAPADSVRQTIATGTVTVGDASGLRLDAAQRGDTLFVLGGAETQTVTRLADVLLRRLFEGITLSADQDVQARGVITKLLRDQAARQDSVRPAMQAFIAKSNELRATRDSALFALLTNDVDRAMLSARVTPGARGRSGGGAPPGRDPLAGVPGGGARVGGGGRGRSGGGAPPDIAQVTDVAFQRLFDGIALTPDQETRARDAIARQQTDQRALVLPRALPALVALLPADGKVILEARSDSALMSLLTSDADRQKLRDRIVNPK